VRSVKFARPTAFLSPSLDELSVTRKFDNTCVMHSQANSISASSRRVESGLRPWTIYVISSAFVYNTARTSQTINTITIMVPTNPKPSILFLL
jgi:hypothetical protein